MAQVLVVEDEQPINELICRNLKLVGHTCEQVFDGGQALDVIGRSNFDLIILDVMLPTLSGFEIIKEIKDIPVIFLTAKDGLSFKLEGLNLGAEDYIIKPFETLELLARVEVILRRTKKSTKIFKLDYSEVNLESRMVYFMESQVDLTPKEYELLEVLIINRNVALSRDKLLELAWGYDFLGDSRTVDVHIQKLRKKLGWEDRIKTVYKLGYRLEV